VLAFWHFGDELSDGKMAEAKAALDTALRLAPNDPAVIEDAGDYYYYGFRDYVRATEQYLRLQALRPNDPEMFYSLGLIQRRQGRFADALVNMRRALELDPANRSMRAELADALTGLRRYDDATAVLAPLLAAHPDDIITLFTVCDIDFRAHGSSAAFDRARNYKPRTPEENQLYLLGLKGAAGETGDWAEFMRLVAQQPYFEGSEREPHWSQDVGVAAVAAEMGDQEQSRRRAAAAVVVMQAELTRSPQNSLLWSNLALAHAFLGHHDECLRCIAKVREIMPESWDALLGPQRAADCVEALAWAGEKDQALAEAARLLQVPYGLNVHSMATEGGALKTDPRYLELLKDPRNNAPIL
jgi:tetratricopeptide (TPR) repeat protein